jgi:uncharacterized protein
MALDLKPSCEWCAVAIPRDGVAFICSYECTYCEACTAALGATCPKLRRRARAPAPPRLPLARRRVLADAVVDRLGRLGGHRARELASNRAVRDG